jgi:hypothetical protein
MTFAAFTSALIVRQGTARLAAHYLLPVHPLSEHADHHCQQRHAGNIAPPDRSFYGRRAKTEDHSGSGALALCDACS